MKNPFTNSKIDNPLIPKTTGTKLKGETANFIALQKRYVKGFLAAYYRFNDQLQMIPGAAGGTSLDDTAGKGTVGKNSWSIRNMAMYLVDSDFDTEDEEFADDIEEVISSGDHGNHLLDNSAGSNDEDDDG